MRPPKLGRLDPEVVTPWDYPADHHIRRVSRDGYLLWQDQRLYLSEALAKQHIAIARRDDGDWSLRFRDFDLATLAQDTGKLRSLAVARSGHS